MTERLDAMKAMIDATDKAYNVAPFFVNETLCALVEESRKGAPLPVLTEISEEAEWWAANATPIDLEAYLSAIGRHLADTSLHQKTRKRIIAAMFKKMSPDDRAAFLAWATAQNGGTDGTV